MFVFDTDHLSLLVFPESAVAARIVDRLGAMHIWRVTTTIVSYEEQTRGWLARVAGAKDSPQQIEAYECLHRNLKDFCTTEILDFDEEAAAELNRLQRMKMRIGAMDLKIAAIALIHGATLVTRNLGDFKKVPGLEVEDWTT
jgi:tRNA(fMet)-specific endonuclease VapC